MVSIIILGVCGITEIPPKLPPYDPVEGCSGYVSIYSDIHIFRKYADEHGWIQHYDYIKIAKKEHLKVQLNVSSFKNYPYVDTFHYLNKGDKILSTHLNKDEDKTKLVSLRATNGKVERVK